MCNAHMVYDAVCSDSVAAAKEFKWQSAIDHITECSAPARPINEIHRLLIATASPENPGSGAPAPTFRPCPASARILSVGAGVFQCEFNQFWQCRLIGFVMYLKASFRYIANVSRFEKERAFQFGLDMNR